MDQAAAAAAAFASSAWGAGAIVGAVVAVYVDFVAFWFWQVEHEAAVYHKATAFGRCVQGAAVGAFVGVFVDLVLSIMFGG